MSHRDLAPVFLVPMLAIAMLPLVGSFPAWVTLTVAGLAMGMMIFIMASGLTLVFGLMDVLNFGHGAFVSVGAYAATIVLVRVAGWSSADSFLASLPPSENECDEKFALRAACTCIAAMWNASKLSSCTL